MQQVVIDSVCYPHIPSLENLEQFFIMKAEGPSISPCQETTPSESRVSCFAVLETEQLFFF